LFAFGCLVAGLVLVGAAPASAAEEDVSFQVAVDDTSLSRSSANHPIVLDPEGQASLTVSITNNGDSELQVRAVRLTGQVVGATFYTYDTTVAMQLEAGETQERTFDIDLFSLGGQATGLIPSTVEIVNQDRETIASDGFVADVRGSIRSTYGYFGLGVALLTAIGLVHNFVKLVKDDLPESRWGRAAAFGLPGSGLGLTIVFTLSALRIFVPTNDRAGVITAVLFAAFFGFGYLTPNPEEEEEALPPRAAAPPPPTPQRAI
jgi:hypothetical protein